MNKRDKKTLKEFFKTISVIAIICLVVASCSNRSVEYEVFIEKDTELVQVDSLVFEATDSTERKVYPIENFVEVYRVRVDAEYDVENYDYQNFSESGYVIKKESIDSLGCALKGKLKKRIDEYYELRDLENELQKLDCN